MAALNEEQKERLRTLTVELLLCVRRQYLRTPGCSPLKHWDQLSTRMLGAARTTTNPDEWTTKLLRSLQIVAPDKHSSACLIDLGAAVREAGAAAEWLALVERELALMIAMARKLSEQRKEAMENV